MRSDSTVYVNGQQFATFARPELARMFVASCAAVEPSLAPPAKQSRWRRLVGR